MKGQGLVSPLSCEVTVRGQQPAWTLTASAVRVDVPKRRNSWSFLVSTEMWPCHKSTHINGSSTFSLLPSAWKRVCHISASLDSCPLVSVGYEVNFLLVNRGSGGHTITLTWLD